MDAESVIEQIQKLPPEECGKVEAYIRAANGASAELALTLEHTYGKERSGGTASAITSDPRSDA